MVDKKPLLQPFPTWEMHKLHDCTKLQNIHSMEIDPGNGWLWMIDIGRVNVIPPSGSINRCPPKLIVYNLETNKVIRQYVFSNEVANHNTSFLNDITVDPSVKRAYITDSAGPSIVVYDYGRNLAWAVNHAESMGPDSRYQGITINNHTRHFNGALNGLALSPDFKILYYCPLASLTLYGVHTEQIKEPRQSTNLSVMTVGTKPSQADGLYMGHSGLYYGALSLNSLYRWERSKDATTQGKVDVTIKTQTLIAKDDMRMQWVNSMSIDSNGYVWFSSTRGGDFLKGAINFTDTSINFRIWKIDVDDKSYLSIKPVPSSSSHSCVLITMVCLLVLPGLTI